jgi:nitroreductase
MVDISQYDCLLNLVKKRRTIRQFRSDPVPDEYITKIIEVARWAPSAFHTQPWEFVIIKNQDIKNKIVAALEQHGPPIKVYVVSESGTIEPLKRVDTLKALPLLPGGPIIIPSCC